MKFGEKVRQLRTGAGMSQKELAEALGVSLRTVTNYETCSRYPKSRDVYGRMADLLGCDINYLLTEEESAVISAAEKYGASGARQMSGLIAEVSGLFSGGELAEEDKDELLRAIEEAYWIAKKKNKKYSTKK